jgi:hypothetical protein
MARLLITAQDGREAIGQDGREAMAKCELNVDMREYERGLFGRCRWRLATAMALVRLATWVLGCKVQFTREVAP